MGEAGGVSSSASASSTSSSVGGGVGALDLLALEPEFAFDRVFFAGAPWPGVTPFIGAVGKGKRRYEKLQRRE